MKKRKNLFPQTSGGATGSPNPHHHQQQHQDSTYGKIKGKRPAARDGHTGFVFGKYFMVFGGDRHHMPFNDSFLLDVKAELTSKSAQL